MNLFGLHFSVRRVSEIAQETPTVLQRLHRLEIAFGELVEHHNALQSHHNKLRNQFHGAKGGRPVGSGRGSLSEIPYGDKAALRKALHVVPGQPYNHRSEDE